MGSNYAVESTKYYPSINSSVHGAAVERRRPAAQRPVLLGGWCRRDRGTTDGRTKSGGKESCV